MRPIRSGEYSLLISSVMHRDVKTGQYFTREIWKNGLRAETIDVPRSPIYEKDKQ